MKGNGEIGRSAVRDRVSWLVAVLFASTVRILNCGIRLRPFQPDFLSSLDHLLNTTRSSLTLTLHTHRTSAMSAPKLPGSQPGPSSQPTALAAQRAREIQDALKSIVLQTASTLRAKTQLARLQASVPTSSSSAASSVNENSSSLDKLTGECTRYLSLVHGLRDYLLHAQAALEIELEAATQREAEEAKKAAEAAAEALKQQQQAEQDAKKKAEEEAERKRIEDEEKAKNAVAAAFDKKDDQDMQNADAKKQANADDTLSGLATPPLPSAKIDSTEADKTDTGDAKKDDSGHAANDAIVIDSDGDDDEDDVPLAFAPKTDASTKAIDLTDSPALANAANPVSSSTASGATQPPEGTASTGASAAHDPSAASADAVASAATAAAGIPGLDLSAFGINLSSLSNLPDLSSLGIPSLANASTSSTDASSFAPATDFSELEKMMGIGLSSTTGNSSGADNAGSAGAVDLSSLGNFNLGGGGVGFGDDADMFGGGVGGGSGGLDLSNFDFSSLGGSAGGIGDAGNGGVDFSSFLTNFTSGANGEGNTDGNAAN